MEYLYSFIIPVFNRPDEIDELLSSLINQNLQIPFEVVIVEDGSTKTCDHIIKKYNSKIQIHYFQKENTGPGDSRNFGIKNANGNFFLILDSDVILPANYLQNIDSFLKKNTTIECFGGPDLAHVNFSNLQKAIDFTMTSFLTTGGIRGNKRQIQQYEPRSFNMGISQNVFRLTNGFTNIHPGEDPDLSIRIQKLGFPTVFLPNAGVYHKRRISWYKFFQQVYKFGLVRPILFKKHKSSFKLSYFFPSIFSIGLLCSFLLLFIGYPALFFLFLLYMLCLVLVSFMKYKSVTISLFVILAVTIQFVGYGFGFLKSIFYFHLLNYKPQKQFPFLFYKGNNTF
ncbi:glycosyltransferase [Psychroflexus planctonicus]|uniref:Glycosyl transferase family 2 n=1 Tax=Psychroflexus planctonicus TaxID=1526575 RepID=A0ABQ1SEB3_9FLAO|nr:glycosyltransferase [Psychroflexus planctonicus]GGE30535.1 glycosyl transferase family 2 [Psychroflexus planctonicus]